MRDKDQKAREILKLLADMKWPNLGPFAGGGMAGDVVHGGIDICAGHPRGVTGGILVRQNEVYVGQYSALADAIRDWQDTPGGCARLLPANEGGGA